MATNTPRPPQRFAPEGLLALAPQAFGGLFEVPEPRPIAQRDGVAIVEVRGPMVHHRSRAWDSYEAIVERVESALAAKPRAVVISIDSPGGLVSGCFEASRRLRELARAAGVPLYAYIDGTATSAGYAIVCAADRVVAPPSAQIGSVGVLATLVDATRQASALGLSFTFVSSGKRKAYGQPQAPVTDEARQDAQRRVDELAGLFFQLVADHRGMSAAAVRSLEGGIVHGAEAKRLGLVDEVATLSEFLASIAKGPSKRTASSTKTPAAPAASGPKPTTPKATGAKTGAEKATVSTKTKKKSADELFDEAKRHLEKTISDPNKSDGEKRRARRMLQILRGEDDKPAKKKDEDDRDYLDKRRSGPRASVSVKGSVQAFGALRSRGDEIKRAFAQKSRVFVAVQYAERNVEATARTIKECEAQVIAAKADVDTALTMCGAHKQIADRAAELARGLPGERNKVAAQNAQAQWEASGETFRAKAEALERAEQNLEAAKRAHKDAKKRLEDARAERDKIAR